MEILENNNSSVQSDLQPILLDSKNVLLITGFSTLDFFADYVKKTKNQKVENVRLLLGNEFIGLEINNNKSIRKVVKEYWKKRGFKLNEIKKVKILRDLLANKITFPYLYNIEVRIDESDKAQHSKLYIGDNFASIGSSNFSKNGFSIQKETNVLIKKEDSGFKELKELSEQYWDEAVDYKDDLLKLLDHLLNVVDYKQVLKVIHDDFLKGDWYSSIKNCEINQPLWKHQELTVSESLIALDKTGSVIIAEPTGSGKTKASVEVVKNLYDKYFLNGKSYLSPPRVTVIAPPRVEEEWLKELENYGIFEPNFISSGILSTTNKNKRDNKLSNLDKAREILSKTDILLIDEAHEYKELENNKSLNLMKYNNADYTLFLTATPINKGIKDYFGFLVLIGANSLEKEHRNSINEIFSRNIQNVSNLKNQNDLNILSDYVKAIKSVTVRKTKSDINEICLENNVKTYPRENSKEYDIDLNKEDLLIIEKIKKLSGQLNGLAFFSELDKQINQIDILKERDKCKGIAKWKILYYLRSSPISLLYHIKGSEYIKEKYNITDLSFKEGLEEKITRKKARRLLTTSVLPVNSDDYLYIGNITDDFSIELIKETEILIYEEIFKLTEKLSDDIIDKKIDLIIRTSKENKKVIVFDKTPITVVYTYNKLKERLKNEDIDVLYAIGENGEVARDQIKSNFSKHNIKTKDKRTIGICSNVLSESVNLEVANIEIFLDIPTTPIIAEQRIGRISRMSSVFENIDIYWPRFPESLMLETDKLLVNRLENINKTISGNINIPDFLLDYANKTSIYNNLDLEDLGVEKELIEIEDFESSILGTQPLKTIKDLFYDKKGKLIYDIEKTEKPLKNESIYSFLEGDNEWGLLYLQKNENNIPILCFIEKDLENDSYKVFYDYENICENFHKKMGKVNELNNFYNINEKKLNNNLKDYENFIRKELNKEQLTSKEKSLLELLRLMSENVSDDYSFIIDYLEDENFNNKKILANNWFNFIKKHWLNFISTEYDNKNKLPVYSDLFYDSKLQEDFAKVNKVKAILESNLHKKKDAIKIKAAILSIKK